MRCDRGGEPLGRLVDADVERGARDAFDACGELLPCGAGVGEDRVAKARIDPADRLFEVGEHERLDDVDRVERRLVEAGDPHRLLKRGPAAFGEVDGGDDRAEGVHARSLGKGNGGWSGVPEAADATSKPTRSPRGRLPLRRPRDASCSGSAN